MACAKGNIIFYEKSFLDLDKPNPQITITDPVATNTGQTNVDFMRNRSNVSAWSTSESNDSANTEILVELYDYQNITDIMLIKHTFKNYLIEYLPLGSIVFSEYVNVINNEKDTTIHTQETAIESNTIKITIYNTIVADEDKFLAQLIITDKFLAGQLESYPAIKNPKNSKNRKTNLLLSGKVNVVEKRGAFSCELNVKLNEANDLDIIESIYENREGVLMLLSGADEDQFITKRLGYRNEDIILVRPVNELIMPYDSGLYTGRIKIKMKLTEAVF